MSFQKYFAKNVCYGAFLFAIISMPSCTKFDLDTNLERAPKDFFAIDKPVSPEIAAIIQKLRIDNDKTGFVSRIPRKAGSPIWDKLKIIKAKKPGISAASFRNATNSLAEDSAFVLPFTQDNSVISNLLVINENSGNYYYANYQQQLLYNLTHSVTDSRHRRQKTS